MQEGEDQIVTGGGAPGPATTRAVGSYPFWKRGLAVVWVLVLCAISGLAGLFVASLVVPNSFSSY